MANLIRVGIHAVDSYTIMCAFYLFLAYVGAVAFSTFWGVKRTISILLAVLWTTMPVIWTHSGYSMLSLGIALLPLYFYTIVVLVFKERLRTRNYLAFFIVCILAIFMDGYSFVMFAVGSLFVLFSVFWGIGNARRRFEISLTFVVGFFFSYLLYAMYLGEGGFTPSSLDFFRAWGMDVSFFLLPTKGVLWVWDLLNLSISRSTRDFFGDASAWISTFALPIYIAGIFSWFFTKEKKRAENLLLLLALIAFYFALGPSFKFNSIKPEEMGALMPEKFALFPTGTAFLSESVPGFNNMRATYRWLALGIFSCWGLLVFFLAAMKNKKTLFSALIIIVLIFFNLPELFSQNKTVSHNRKNFLKIESNLVSVLRNQVKPEERIAFLPYDNDFLVNYLSSSLNAKAYNVGGDKNLSLARKEWPRNMQGFKQAQVDDSFVRRLFLMFAEGDVDVVVFPRIHLLWSAHQWPPVERFKKELLLVVKEIRGNNNIHVVEVNDYYVLCRPSSLYLKQIKSESSGKFIADAQKMSPFYVLGEIVNFDFPEKNACFATSGWSFQEDAHRWTEGSRAELAFVIQDAEPDKDLLLRFEASAYLGGGLPCQVVNVFANGEKVGTWQVMGLDWFEAVIPGEVLHDGLLNITFDISDPTAPSDVGESTDSRKLGISAREFVIESHVPQNRYALGDVVSFDATGESSRFATSGWSFQEDAHRWTEGSRAELAFVIQDAEPDKDLLLRFEASAYLGGGLPCQVVNVFANGEKVGTWQVMGLDWFEAVIPGEVLHDGLLNITFDISDPTAPSDVGESTDSRKLGISAREFVIESHVPQNRYALGDVVSFDATGESSRFATSGWSFQEDAHRWTEDSRAELAFVIQDAEPDKDLLLRFEASAYLGGGLPCQVVNVFANGEKVGTWQVMGLDWFEAVIPGEVLHDGLLNITFDISDPTAPSDVGESTDSRKLGISAREFVIESHVPQNRYALGDVVSFDATGESSRFATSGWSFQEDAHRWTEDSRAELAFVIQDAEPDKDLLLRFEASAYLGGGLPCQVVNVFANGEKVGTWQVMGLDWFEAVIPGEVLHDGLLNITFDISDPTAPSDVGESTDSRKLGISAREFVIEVHRRNGDVID